MNTKINSSDLESFEKDFRSNPDYILRKASVTNNGINASCIDKDLLREMKFTFSVDVDAGEVCNQKRSGRCWMFSGLNVIRTILFKKLNVKNIELSQAYLQFYDKLEKSNFFLEKAMELSSEDSRSRNNVFILDSALGDGGHFVMFSNLVKKYGVVPLSEMPDLAVSVDTAELNSVLTNYLAQGMIELRNAKAKGKSEKDLYKIKKQYLSDIYRILTISLGTPVKDFEYEYVDKDNKYVSLGRLTPKEFYDKYIAEDLEAYVPLCNGPLEGHEKYTKYTCSLVNNVIDGSPVIFFDVSLSEMKKACIDSLKDNMPVWFGADVSTQSLRKDGILADGILMRKELFDIDYHLNKKERLSYRASFCNHAMTFTGVNLVNKKPNRWKVENSWGKENGKNGFFVMSDKWFEEYVYEIYVNRKYLSEKLLEKYDNAPLLETDPFDTLWMYMD